MIELTRADGTRRYRGDSPIGFAQVQMAAALYLTRRVNERADDRMDMARKVRGRWLLIGFVWWPLLGLLMKMFA